MKKLLIATALTLGLTSNVQSAEVGTLESMMMKAKNFFRSAVPTKVIAIESEGFNFRGYLLDAPMNDDMVCMIVAGENKGGMACYPKGENYKHIKAADL